MPCRKLRVFRDEKFIMVVSQEMYVEVYIKKHYICFKNNTVHSWVIIVLKIMYDSFPGSNVSWLLKF